VKKKTWFEVWFTNTPYFKNRYERLLFEIASRLKNTPFRFISLYLWKRESGTCDHCGRRGILDFTITKKYGFLCEKCYQTAEGNLGYLKPVASKETVRHFVA